MYPREGRDPDWAPAVAGEQEGVTERSALQTAAAIRSGTTTALAETEAAIARIEARDGALNAVVVRDFDRAREQARAIDAGPKDDRPLLGVPMTIKESFDVAGLPTTWGAIRDYVATTDAVAMRRLKAAGAVLLGKTNVPVFLADIQSVNPIYGRTNNAVDPTRSAGGSSGGGAVALASGMVPLEFGSDIGGSIRTPAAFNGVWGHKPTYAALPTDGHSPPGTDGASIPLSVIGPLARDGDDLAVALDVVANLALPRARPRAPSDWRILVLTSHPEATVATAVADAIERTAAAFAAAGATVDRTSDLVPDLSDQHRRYMHLLNVSMTRRNPDPTRAPTTLEEWLTLLDAQARNRRRWSAVFDRYDVVFAPVLGHTAFPHDDTPVAQRRIMIDGQDTPMGAQFAFAGIATFPGLPATSVPVGRDGDGMPIGMQVIADTYQDHTAIAAAKAAHDLVWSQ